MPLENEIVLMLKNKDANGLSIAYKSYGGAIYGIVFRMLQSEEVAQEVLQDTFLKAWESIEQYDAKKGKFFTWLSTIARRLAIDHTRSAGFKKETKTKSIDEFVYESEAWSESPNIKDIGLERVIKSLDEKYRVLIDMAYLHGYTHQEIHEKTQIPIGTIKTRLRTAIIELRRVLSEMATSWSILMLFVNGLM